ncbi:MAG: GNAT family N-acetyltransferase [Corynebacteriales bacterium]|nr:GNAT family N-acetyltransferase [Mycobacteriales bacterium]
MYYMRPSVLADREDLTNILRARSAWMRDKGLSGWEGWGERAESIAGQAGDPISPTWTMLNQDRKIVGSTSLFEESPAWCWSEEERAEPAFFLATTYTDPAYAGQKIGSLIAWWALDYAARNGKIWVRRGTGPYPKLVRYYEDVQGWAVVRTVERQGVTAYALARRAEPQPHLATQITEITPA